MHKKAEMTLGMLLEIILVVTVIALLLFYAAKKGDEETIRKIQLADDLKLAVDMLIAAPGNAVIKYPADASPYIIALIGKEVLVYEEGDPELKKIYRGFYAPKDYILDGNSNQQKSLYLKKEGKRISLEGKDE